MLCGVVVLKIVNDWLIKHQLQHKITIKFSGTMIAPAPMKEFTISVVKTPIRARCGSLVTNSAILALSVAHDCATDVDIES